MPVYNEEKILEKNILRLKEFLDLNFKYLYLIEIVDNASTDRTPEISKKLSKLKNINYLQLKEKGKGLAIKASWKTPPKDITILSFMDCDLATDLKQFPELIDSIIIDNYDLSIGSRYEKNSKTKRSIKRWIISRCYNVLLRVFLNIKVKDTQCGFKAIKKNKYDLIKNKIEDNKFFIDTEIIYYSSKNKYKIKSIPVKWKESKTTTVNIFGSSVSFIKNIFKLYFK
ncbi:MAG: glycosyltransferase [Candidatus ainarchaeum sp.]|nr:glycosyltransferase [Candidatus ainarchaeum sp.]